MAKCSDNQASSVRMRVVKISKIAGVAAILMFSFGATAQSQECTTTKECAQQMVELANEIKAENVLLSQKIANLETALAKQVAASNAALAAKFKALRAVTGALTPQPGGNGKSSVCPKGQFMVGNLWQVDAGNSHGVMSWISPICRKFP